MVSACPSIDDHSASHSTLRQTGVIAAGRRLTCSGGEHRPRRQPHCASHAARGDRAPQADPCGQRHQTGARGSPNRRRTPTAGTASLARPQSRVLEVAAGFDQSRSRGLVLRQPSAIDVHDPHRAADECQPRTLRGSSADGSGTGNLRAQVLTTGSARCRASRGPSRRSRRPSLRLTCPGASEKRRWVSVRCRRLWPRRWSAT